MSDASRTFVIRYTLGTSHSVGRTAAYDGAARQEARVEAPSAAEAVRRFAEPFFAKRKDAALATGLGLDESDLRDLYLEGFGVGQPLDGVRIEAVEPA